MKLTGSKKIKADTLQILVFRSNVDNAKKSKAGMV